jgi:hypothetical protein
VTVYTVALTPLEMDIGELVGRARGDYAMSQGWTNYDGEKDPHYEQNIGGARSEMAVARLFGVYWSGAGGLGAIRTGDVGRVEVRSTTNPRGPLHLYKGRDKPERYYVLVHNEAPRFHVVGYRLAAEVMTHGEWRPKGRYPEGWQMEREDLIPLNADDVRWFREHIAESLARL